VLRKYNVSRFKIKIRKIKGMCDISNPHLKHILDIPGEQEN
jgi:hypothetical protein